MKRERLEENTPDGLKLAQYFFLRKEWSTVSMSISLSMCPITKNLVTNGELLTVVTIFDQLSNQSKRFRNVYREKAAKTKTSKAQISTSKRKNISKYRETVLLSSIAQLQFRIKSVQ